MLARGGYGHGTGPESTTCHIGVSTLLCAQLRLHIRRSKKSVLVKHPYPQLRAALRHQ